MAEVQANNASSLKWRMDYIGVKVKRDGLEIDHLEFIKL